MRKNKKGRNPEARARRIWAFLRFLITFLFLSAAWFLFSFRFDFFSLAAGFTGAFLVARFTYPLFVAEHEAARNALFPRPHWLILSLLLVIGEMYVSSIKMLGAVIRGHGQPGVVHFRTRLNSDLGRTALSNSITFTPGTITLDLNDDHLTVHWFFCTTQHSRAAGEEVKGRMERALRRCWS